MIFNNIEEVKNYTKFLDNNIRAFVGGALTTLTHEKTILFINNMITINQYQRQMNTNDKFLLIYNWETNTEKLYKINK